MNIKQSLINPANIINQSNLNMARGIRKHLKRIAAPKSWLMDKMGGVFTVKPDPGPHKLRESIPL